MKHKTLFTVLLWLFVSALLLGQAYAQGAVAPSSQCVPAAAQPAAQAQPGRGGAGGGGGGAQQRIPRDATVTMIPGVVAAGATWTKVWQAGGNSADGIVADKDGNAL